MRESGDRGSTAPIGKPVENTLETDDRSTLPLAA
jgi:hypothetical protein